MSIQQLRIGVQPSGCRSSPKAARNRLKPELQHQGRRLLGRHLFQLRFQSLDVGGGGDDGGGSGEAAIRYGVDFNLNFTDTLDPQQSLSTCDRIALEWIYGTLTVLDESDWYTHITVIGRITEVYDDDDLADIDALSRHYTGEPYPVRDRPRVSAL